VPHTSELGRNDDEPHLLSEIPEKPEERIGSQLTESPLNSVLHSKPPSPQLMVTVEDVKDEGTPQKLLEPEPENIEA
jgi:hypothetical protein